MIQTEKISNKNINTLWSLFKDYHNEVSNYSNEQPLPSKEKFKTFWLEKPSYILSVEGSYKGFVLLQEVDCEVNGRYLEVGAIFMKQKSRGMLSIRLYKTALEEAAKRNIPLASEIAQDNLISIGIFNSLSHWYSRKEKITTTKKKLKNGRYFVTCKTNS